MQGNNPPEILFNLIEHSPSEWTWWIRCHPMMIEKLDHFENAFSRFDKNVNVREASNFSTYLLSKADIHVTGWSAVTYDALSFGLKTILTHPSANQFFEPLITSKQAFYFENWREILSFIKTNEDKLLLSRSLSQYNSVKSNKLVNVMISVIDCGLGNINSVIRMINKVGGRPNPFPNLKNCLNQKNWSFLESVILTVV